MREICNEDYVVAIGECGLDYKRNYSSKEDQFFIFAFFNKVINLSLKSPRI